jgi:hypothetical protein
MLKAEHPVGLMLQPGNGFALQAPLFRWWAADNGCFADPEGFTVEGFLEWLAPLGPHRETCLFAVAPDVLGDAAATLRRSAPVLPLIRELGFPAALVSQDGLESPPWDSFDCLFVGGTNAWKFSSTSRALCLEARKRGKWVHVGRVNSEKGINRARWMQANSSDGTFLKFGPDKNIARLLRWFRQQPLLGVA